MEPFTGRRWYEVEPERLAWHVFSVGVLGLLLLVLLVSVQSLGEPQSSKEIGAPDRIAVPAKLEGAAHGREQTRVQGAGGVERTAGCLSSRRHPVEGRHAVSRPPEHPPHTRAG